MKIGIIGASGKAGNEILKEAKTRGHEVTAIVRNASKVQEQDIAILEKDVFELTAEDIKPFDAVVNAFGAAPGQEHLHVEAGRALINILKMRKTQDCLSSAEQEACLLMKTKQPV